MARSQLWQWLKDNGISQEQAARSVGFTVNYVNSMLRGHAPLSDSARLRFIEAYPETVAFLLRVPTPERGE